MALIDYADPQKRGIYGQANEDLAAAFKRVPMNPAAIAAQPTIGNQLRMRSAPAATPAPVQTMDYSKKGPAMTVPQGAAPTDPDAPKPQAPSIVSNPNSVYAGWGGPAQAAAPRQPLPADRDPFANRAALAQVAQPPQPTNPVVAAPGTAAPIGRSLSSVAAPGAQSTDYGNEGRGTSPAQPQLGPLSALAQGRNGELPPGITMTKDAQGNITYSSGVATGGAGGGVGGGVGGGDPGRSPMDIYRSEAAIRGLDPNTFEPANRPRGGSIGDSTERDQQAFNNFTLRSALESAIHSAEVQNTPRSLASIAGLATAAERLGGQIPAQDLARDALAQRGDLEGQRLAQDGQYRQATLANQQAELGIKGQELGLRTAGQADTAATNAVARQGSLADIAQKKFLSDLQQKALSDPAAAAQYRALTGKSEVQPYEPIYTSTKDQMGNESKAIGGRFNKATGQYEPIGGAQAPSYADFGAQIRAKNPGQTITDQQLQDAYKQQFGR